MKDRLAARSSGRIELRTALVAAALALVAAVLPAAVGSSGGRGAAGASPPGIVAANDVRPAAVAEENIYRVLYSDGSIESFGAGGSTLTAATEPAAGLASGIGNNFLSVTAAGKVNPYAATTNWGSPLGLPLNAPVVGVAQYPQGNGYWVVGGDGGVFAYNAAQFYGSTGSLTLVAPVIGIVNSPSGNGYWTYASDGGVFSFGDSRFYGSAAGISNAKIVGMASTISGKGYWLLGADGGVFAFGDAKFAGSAVNDLVSPAVGIAASNNGGYWILSADGGIYSYGGAPYQGRGSKAAVAISAAQPRYVELQVLGINDFHGNLEPPGGAIGGLSVGGSEYLATQLKTARGNFGGNSITVTAGDNVGASPLISALFSDEPTIQSLGSMGVELAAVGNHEFDRGSSHLLRLQNGGCAGDADACKTGAFGGASFQYLSANVVVNSSGKTLFPATAIKTYSGVKVGFIGLTLKGTPDIVTPSGVAGLTFGDEIQSINAQVPLLKAQGANAIVVLIHEGGTPNGSDYNACPSFTGAITAIAQGVDSSVKAIVSGHTHQPYNCIIGGKRVTSASSFGRVFTDMRLWLDRNTGEVVDVLATNKLVTRDVAKDSAQSALITQYKALSGPLEARVVGKIAGAITRTAGANGESPLGDLIADSQLAATSGASVGNAVIAFMNPGGIRSDLPPSGPLPSDGSITYGNIFTVQPFGNSLTVKTMTGAQIQSVLEQQFVGCGGQTTQRILQISNGLTYTINPTAANCADKVTNLQLGGNPIVSGDSYRVTMNSFLADGGDGFTVFRQGTNQLGGALDLDAVEQYFQGLGSPPATVPVPAANRISLAS